MNSERLCGKFLAALMPLLCLRLNAQSEIQCPSTLIVQETADITSNDGWRTHDNSVKGKHNFYGVAFSEGPPENQVYQVRTKTMEGPRSKTAVYDFSQVSDDIWVSCLYRDTSQSLTRKLPQKFARCEVAYDPTSGFRSVKKITCF